MSESIKDIVIVLLIVALVWLWGHPRTVVRTEQQMVEVPQPCDCGPLVIQDFCSYPQAQRDALRSHLGVHPDLCPGERPPVF